MRRPVDLWAVTAAEYAQAQRGPRPLPDAPPGVALPPTTVPSIQAPAPRMIVNPLIPAAGRRQGRLLPSSAAEARAGLTEFAGRVARDVQRMPVGGFPLMPTYGQLGRDIARRAHERFGRRPPARKFK